MACNKKEFTKQEAMAALGAIRWSKKRTARDNRPSRTYYCKNCEAWHLTKMSTKQFYKSNKKRR
ncbi:hypothetical protein ACTJIJ_22865 [Niabella sp. 22666]|uniref:hypothetical protein n=1 Tax=Niabella sp. 22666 TaxID=3453954 RepID=UPI003F82ACA4